MVPLKIDYLPVDNLRPYERNARTHSAEQVSQIAESIRQFGWTNPILIDEDNEIIAGHGRLAAALEIGLAEVPVIRLEGLTVPQKRALALADNKLALNAGWDEKLLAAELLGLDAQLRAAVGFSADELVAFLANPAADDHADEIPALSTVPPVTQLGDLWIMGDHRLICGDCRDAAVVNDLLDGRLINIGFTSPPYAEQREYDSQSGFKPIPPDEYVQWFAPVAANVADHLADDGSWFVNIKPSASGLDTELYVMDTVLAHVRLWGWHFATEFCWERNGVPKSVTQRFKNQFEPIYQFARNHWKMRPDAVRHESDHVPRAGGSGSGQTSWGEKQGSHGGIKGSFGTVKKRRNGTKLLMSDMQGTSVDAGEYIGPGLAYPGNRLPTFTASHTATGHAAEAFPVGLPEFFIRAFSDNHDVILDPFLGSGSTIIAAERTARHGLGCEISPAYCDVAVTRWENFTGCKATRVPARADAA